MNTISDIEEVNGHKIAVLWGLYSKNGYIEIPKEYPTDYMGNCFEDVQVAGGLTFGGYVVSYPNGKVEVCFDNSPVVGGIDKVQTSNETDEKYISNVSSEAVLKEFKSQGVISDYFRCVGFDTNHILEMNSYDVHGDCVRLSKEIWS